MTFAQLQLPFDFDTHAPMSNSRDVALVRAARRRRSGAFLEALAKQAGVLFVDVAD